ncbi:MAG TPA: efflux RND transporter periplasmic adaptor subunit [Steroidobacteraceae bacterium]|nr:efflux RND transporter periplasmic adaptor subunit [Steroidobacteraceae bacterium]
MMRTLIKSAAIGMAAAMALAGCGKEQGQHAPPPPEVTVQTVGQQPVPLELTYTARTIGSREVEVRARVGGIVLKRRYQEGSRVLQGQPMFLIDPEPVRARVGSARAEVAVAKARLEESRRNRDRVLPLFEKNAVSQSRRDEAVSAFEVAQANVLSAESQLRMAQLDLEYTDVRAPISGLTSREVLSEGSLVSTEQASSLLTKIVQVDPLYVEFNVPEAEASLIRAGLAPANKGAPAPGVRLVLEDGSEYATPAQVTFVDNAVDRSSGTVRVRAVLPNKEAQLIPGQFIRAKVEGIQLSNVVSIPRKAVMSGPQGSFVWVVGADAKAQMRPVQVGRSMGNNVIVTDGLQSGDRYIVEGVMKVMQPGIQVSAVTAEEAARRQQQQAAAQPKEAA